MSDVSSTHRHDREHSMGAQVSPYAPASHDVLRVGSRRWFLQTGLAGMAGLTLPQLLQLRRATAANSGTPKSVILFWLSGCLLYTSDAADE